MAVWAILLRLASVWIERPSTARSPDAARPFRHSIQTRMHVGRRLQGAFGIACRRGLAYIAVRGSADTPSDEGRPSSAPLASRGARLMDRLSPLPHPNPIL